MKNLIAMDFAGRYPVTSKQGHKYIFIMYNYNSNYTFAVPVKSQKTSEYLRAFQECYDELKQRGFTAQLLQLDNEISKDLDEFQGYVSRALPIDDIRSCSHTTRK